MACSNEYIEFVCSQLEGVGVVRPRKMFGDWCVYVDEKAVILACDNLCYVKKHDAVAELIEEGYVREVISKVQTMHKEADFEVMDHITLSLAGNAKIAEICGRNEAFIKQTVLADAIVYDTLADGYTKDWNLNGEDVTITVKKN